VGKSTVAVLLAQALAARGKRVGVLDADITGPSIPRLLGVDDRRADSDGEKIRPIVNAEGIKLLSINLLTEDEDAPIIWRGPMLAGAIQQFWTDCAWGELDYLIVDFPPNTSDVTLTAYQTIPLAGIIIVATPQDYVSMIVRKSVRMAEQLNAPILGVVENMRSLICPKCGEEIALFDDGEGDSGTRVGLPLIASLPWRKEIAHASALRWADIGEAGRRDADKLADAAERAPGFAGETDAADDAGRWSGGSGEGASSYGGNSSGCGGSCGESDCCSGCASAPKAGV